MKRVLICGLGSIGQRHVRLLQQALGSTVEIHAYRSRGLDIVIQDNMQALPGVSPITHYGLKAHTSLEGALACKPDIAFITNPISLHVPVAQEAASAGCHLFIEKPLGCTLDGLDALQRTVDQQKRIAYVGYQLRFHPALQKTKALLQSGLLGRLTSASLYFGEWLPGMHPYEDYRISHAARADQGGGAILCLSHEIDYACWLFGYPRKVTALGGTLSSLEMDVEDTADLLLECRWENRPLPVNVHVDFIQRRARRGFFIVGEEGTLEWNYFTNELVHRHGPGTESQTFAFDGFKRNDMFTGQLANFLASLEGATPVTPLSDGIATLRVCLAAKESLKTGTTVPLPSLP